MSIERLPLSARAELPPPCRRIQKALSQMVLIETDLPSHFNVRLKRFSSLDRWYFALPSWYIRNVTVHASLAMEPLECARDGVSDHSPSGVFFAPFTCIPTHMRPISSRICRDPYFSFVLNKMVVISGLRDMQGDRRLRMHKEFLREAANKTRQHKMI